jgi:hypothetical protein
MSGGATFDWWHLLYFRVRSFLANVSHRRLRTFRNLNRKKARLTRRGYGSFDFRHSLIDNEMDSLASDRLAGAGSLAATARFSHEGERDDAVVRFDALSPSIGRSFERSLSVNSGSRSPTPMTSFRMFSRRISRTRRTSGNCIPISSAPSATRRGNTGGEVTRSPFAKATPAARRRSTSSLMAWCGMW